MIISGEIYVISHQIANAWSYQTHAYYTVTLIHAGGYRYCIACDYITLTHRVNYAFDLTAVVTTTNSVQLLQGV